MVKVAVTGGIGCGKSYVCKLLGERDIRVYDCDRAAKRIMASSLKIQDELRKLVGDSVYSDGVLNKAVLAAFLLKSEDNTTAVNKIVHPAVADDFVKSGDKWMECAILFSSGFDKLVDKVICVTAPLEVRVERIIQRDGITREKALEWIDKQQPQEQMVSLSDYEIINDGEADLEEQIDSVLTSLRLTDVLK